MRTSRRVIKAKDKNREKKFFKPMVATSLALALGVSVNSANATDITGTGTQDINQDTTGNIYLPTDSTTGLTVNFGTSQKVSFAGTIGGKINGSVNVADLKVNFLNGSTMNGTIQTGQGDSVDNYGNDFSANIVNFSGATNDADVVLSGDIVSYGTGPYASLRKENGNHITFANGSMTGNIKASDTNGTYSRTGYNQVSFSANGNQNLTGDIIAIGGVNSVSFSGTGTKTITGNLSAQYRNRSAWNEIESTASLLVIGSGSASSIVADKSAYNQVVANALKIDIKSMNSLNSGSNTIEVTSQLELISNDVTAKDLGSNYIKAGSLVLSTGSLIAGVGGHNSKNLIEAGNTTLKSSLIIQARNAQNNNSAKLNVLKFTGSFNSTNNAIITEISAIATNENGRANSKNILSFEGLTNSTNLTIQDINKQDTVRGLATGNNYIGKALTSGNSYKNLTLAGGFSDSNWSDTTYCAENLSLTVSGAIYGYRSGINYINVGSMIVNNLDADGGYNKIATSGDFTANIIKGRWNGNNTIIIGGNATINGSIYAEGSDGGSGYSGSNTFTFLNSSATFTMANNQKISVGGNGSNTFNFQGNQTTFNSDLTLERTAGSGKNIFNIADAKRVSFASGKMLNTLSGQTEITFQGTGGSFGTSGGGKVKTDNGTTTFVFSQDTGTYSISGELSANNGGQNIIDLSSKSATINTDLTLSGSPTGSGGNIIKIGDGKSLSFADNGTNKTLSTTSGVSQVNFLNASGTFKGDLNTSGGTMTFSFQDNGTYTVSGNFATSNTGKNIFDLSSQSVTISNDLTFSGSSVDASAGNIINIGNGKTLNIQSGGGGEQSLQTLDLVESISMEHQELLVEKFLQRVA